MQGFPALKKKKKKPKRRQSSNISPGKEAEREEQTEDQSLTENSWNQQPIKGLHAAPLHSFLSCSSFDPLPWACLPLQRSLHTECKFLLQAALLEQGYECCLSWSVKAFRMQDCSVCARSCLGWAVMFKARWWGCACKQIRKRSFKTLGWNRG